jgi:hypothetical protein
MDQTHHHREIPGMPRASEPHTRAAAHRNAYVPGSRTHAPTVAATDREEGPKPLGKNSL